MVSRDADWWYYRDYLRTLIDSSGCYGILIFDSSYRRFSWMSCLSFGRGDEPIIYLSSRPDGFGNRFLYHFSRHGAFVSVGSVPTFAHAVDRLISLARERREYGDL